MKKARVLKVVSGVMLVVGLVMVFGIAGTDEMMVRMGQAGPPLGELIWKSLAGMALVILGTVGLNRGVHYVR